MKRYMLPLLLALTSVLTANNHDLSFSLYKIAQEETETPLFSSYSIATILKMLEEGAAGTTKEEFSKLNIEKPALINDLNHQVAGFVDKRLSLYPSFAEALQTHFSTTWYPTDFREKALASQEINSWLQRTSNPPLFSQDLINNSTRLVLISALSVNGSFAFPFDPALTHSEPFYTDEESSYPATFMEQTRRLPYFEDERAQVVSLPLKDSEMSLVLMLPQTEDAIPPLKEYLDNLSWAHLDLSLPKWKHSFNKELNSWLEHLGIHRAFTPQAEFSKIAQEPLSLSSVIHSATFDVHEEGLNATSATIAIMNLTCCQQSPPLDLTFNRPFLYFLIHTPTQEILFMGRYAQ